MAQWNEALHDGTIDHSMLKIVALLLLVISPSMAQMPDWRARTAPQELPFQINDNERALIVKAMEILAEREPSRKESMFYMGTIDRIKTGWPITLNDIILLNGPLMMAQQDVTLEDAQKIRVLLNKLRKDAADMVNPK